MTTIIIPQRLISQPCETCNATAGKPCTSNSIPDDAQFGGWFHAIAWGEAA